MPTLFFSIKPFIYRWIVANLVKKRALESKNEIILKITSKIFGEKEIKL